MRVPRVLGDPSKSGNYYHVMSRAIDGRFLFGKGGVEAEFFRKLLREHSRFSGVRVLTYAIMSNHFHLLLEVPNGKRQKEAMGDGELLARLGEIYSKDTLIGIRQMLARLKRISPEVGYVEYRERILARMYDLSAFVREVKARFSLWYNKRVGRKGPLWEDRFKSVLAEGRGEVLSTMAGYIDLNAVRAGLVSDPKDYRWSGYGEAVAGDKEMRRGLAAVHGMEGEDWRRVHGAYRRMLYGAGEEVRPDEREGGRPARQGLKSGKAREVERRGGALSGPELVRCRVRYFADGLAIGSRGFVEEVFARNRERMKVKREAGARMTRGGVLGDWRTLKDLRGEQPVVFTGNG